MCSPPRPPSACSHASRGTLVNLAAPSAFPPAAGIPPPSSSCSPSTCTQSVNFDQMCCPLCLICMVTIFLILVALSSNCFGLSEEAKCWMGPFKVVERSIKSSRWICSSNDNCTRLDLTMDPCLSMNSSVTSGSGIVMSRTLFDRWSSMNSNMLTRLSPYS